MTPASALPELKIKIDWIYGRPDDPPLTGQVLTFPMRNLATHRHIGDKFSGKSAMGEAQTATFVRNGSTAYDFHPAKDNENLAWLDGPYKDRVVLVHANDIRLRCPFETMPIGQLDPRRSPAGKIYITCKRFYQTPGAHFRALNRFTTLVQERDDWNRVDVLFIREAQKYIDSKLATKQIKTRREAAQDFVDFHDESYHSGFAVVLDSQRDVRVEKDVRELTTYTYYHNMGGMEIPRKIWWIQSPDLANFDLDTLRQLEPWQFLVMSNRDSVGLGVFEMPPWHVKRGAGLMKRLDIHVFKEEDGQEREIEQVEYQEPPDLDKAPREKRAGRPSQFTPEIMVRLVEMVNGGETSDAMMVYLMGRGVTASQKTMRDHIKNAWLKASVVSSTS